MSNDTYSLSSSLYSQLKIRLSVLTDPFNIHGMAGKERTYLLKNRENGDDPATGIDHMVIGSLETCIDGICHYSLSHNNFNIFSEDMRYIGTANDKQLGYNYNDILAKYGAVNWTVTSQFLDNMREWITYNSPSDLKRG